MCNCSNQNSQNNDSIMNRYPARYRYKVNSKESIKIQPRPVRIYNSVNEQRALMTKIISPLSIIGCNGVAINFTIESNILCFEDEKQFENFVTSLSAYNLDELETKWGYTSYRKTYNIGKEAGVSEEGDIEQLIENEFFATAINIDGFVKIGKWLFLVLPEEEQVIVSEEFSENAKTEMLADPSNPKFTVFTFADDIFALLSTGEPGKHRISIITNCNEAPARCAGNCKEEYSKQYCEAHIGNKKYRYKIIAFHKYREYGLWHDLWTEITNKRRKIPPQLLYWPYPTNYDLAYKVAYKIRCMGSGQLSQVFLQQNLPTTAYRYYNSSHIKFFYYNGTRKLHSYYAYTEWKYTSVCSDTPSAFQIPFIESQF